MFYIYSLFFARKFSQNNMLPWQELRLHCESYKYSELKETLDTADNKNSKNLLLYNSYPFSEPTSMSFILHYYKGKWTILATRLDRSAELLDILLKTYVPGLSRYLVESFTFVLAELYSTGFGCQDHWDLWSEQNKNLHSIIWWYGFQKEMRPKPTAVQYYLSHNSSLRL